MAKSKSRPKLNKSKLRAVSLAILPGLIVAGLVFAAKILWLKFKMQNHITLK